MSLTCPACAHSWEPATTPLTARQRQVLDFILLFQATRRYAPSHEEIATHFGFKSPATVHEHLSNIERKGWIMRDYNAARSLRVIG